MHIKYLAQHWTHRRPSQNGSYYFHYDAHDCHILPHKLPEVYIVIVTDSTDWPTQHPLHPFLRYTVPGLFCSQGSAYDSDTVKQMHICPRKVKVIQIKWQLLVGGSIFASMMVRKLWQKFQNPASSITGMDRRAAAMHFPWEQSHLWSGISAGIVLTVVSQHCWKTSKLLNTLL